MGFGIFGASTQIYFEKLEKESYRTGIIEQALDSGVTYNDLEKVVGQRMNTINFKSDDLFSLESGNPRLALFILVSLYGFYKASKNLK